MSKEGAPRDIHQTAAWAIKHIAARMNQEPVVIHPTPMIEGYGFKVIDPENAEDKRTLGLFPTERVVTITTPAVSLKIQGASVREAQDGVSIEAGNGTVRALFLRDGHIAIEVFPIPSLAVTEPALRDETPLPDESLVFTANSDSGPSSGEIGASAELSVQETAATSEPPESTEREANRVRNLRGRVATEPNLSPTPQGKPRVQFVLAEHVDQDGDDHTVFHRVYTLNKQAESLQRRGLAKGQKVGVDGYRQQRQHRTRDGKVVPQEVIYANVVRTFAKRERVDADEAPREPK